ncbi:MAG: glutamyl-queuosine tRNA(Asp) synthetase [Pseudomonadota bacterium]|jgi:glutamyl-Q tRNA(Asp) synthetase
MSGYRGRFAPSPTGALHAGSLVAALASWLDARAHGGTWLVRIEDVDLPRCLPGAAEEILRQLAACGLRSDEEPLQQSLRGDIYLAALERLVARGWAYPCGCTRKDIEQAWATRGLQRERHAELVYPGTCRPASGGLGAKPARAWRLDVGAVGTALALDTTIEWRDRRLGPQSQDVGAQVGDFVLRRADGLWAYQLAVVVDDAAQGITHVVRGEDLADNTARQILLQRALGFATPAYLHTPLVLGPNGEKLSKQNGAAALDLHDPLAALVTAAGGLGLRSEAASVAEALERWTQEWAHLYNSAP